MSNPVSPFRNNLFAVRPTIQEALNYAEMLTNTFQGTEYAAAKTAIGVLINTIDSVITQSQVTSPQLDQADMLTQLGGMYDKLVNDVVAKVSARDIALIDERIDAHKLIREDAIGDVVDAHIHNLDDKIADWMDNNLRDKMMDILANDDIDDQISNWMSNNFDITDYNVDDAIEQWMDNNLDDKVTDAARCLTFTVEVSR
jgi:hypothetical protein